MNHNDAGLPLPGRAHIKTWDEMSEVERQRVTIFMDYLGSEVCELDLLDPPDEEWADRSWDLSQRLDAETIKWLECGGDINA